MPRHIAAESGKVELLEKLWNWAKETAAKTRRVKELCVFVKRQFN
jgi:hypothetical protein